MSAAAGVPLWAKRTEAFLPEVQAAEKQDQVKWVLAGCRAEFIYAIRDALKHDLSSIIFRIGEPVNAAEWFILKAACDRLGLTEWYRTRKGLTEAGLLPGAPSLPTPKLILPN